jgi:hypothetical protein
MPRIMVFHGSASGRDMSNSYELAWEWTNFVLLEVPEGRHNVARSGSCGNMNRTRMVNPGRGDTWRSTTRNWPTARLPPFVDKAVRLR